MVVTLILQAFSGKLQSKNYETCDNDKDQSFFPSCSHGDRTRYFLKVQDGCNYFCSYCTIPYARGRSRNGSIVSIVEQAKKVVEEGGAEIVITGVNIGDFGKSTNESFIQLIEELNKVEGIKRYRISSIEPNLLTEDIIRFCAQSDKFMPHFHVPLQSGSDQMLKLMKRRYDTLFFENKLIMIKKYIPDAFIGVDVIVGCRGETREYFEDTYNFIEKLPISKLHVFSYSERPGTEALKIPLVVKPEEKHERSKKLLLLSDMKTVDFYSKYNAVIKPVLFEHASNNKYMYGFTDNYIRVQVKADSSLFNTIQNVKLVGFNSTANAMKGEIVL